MTLSAATAKVIALKPLWGTGIFVAALIYALSSAAKVPAKLDTHVAQADTIITAQERTNQKLDVLICLQAKLDTPLRCVAKGH